MKQKRNKLKENSEVNPGSQLRRLSIEELRQYPGNENYSDEELDEQSKTLLELSIILYRYFQTTQHDTSDLKKINNERNNTNQTENGKYIDRNQY